MRSSTLLTMPALLLLASCSSVANWAGSDRVYPIFSSDALSSGSGRFERARDRHDGDGLTRNYAAAADGYRTADGAAALNNLGVMALRGEGRAPSASVASRRFRAAAAEGSAAARFNLGLMHESGMAAGGMSAAAREYRIASEMGFAPAQYRLSVILARGEGVERDPEEAERLAEMAAVGGDREAVAALRQRAGERLGTAAEIRAFLAIEHCVRCGDGEAEAAMAARGYNELVDMADEGDASARYNLAARLLEGDGAVRDPSEAARLFTLAAKQGYAPAQRQIALMHLHGRAVVESPVIAHAWLNLASRGDGAESGRAREEMEALELSMSAAEVREAQSLAASWEYGGR